MGFWLILPFAGLELLALGAALYLSALRGRAREVISIQGERIAVQRGRHAPQETTWFHRGWAKVELARPERRGYPTRLLIRSHGREIEVGRCLSDAERGQLAEDLRRWISLPTLPVQVA